MIKVVYFDDLSATDYLNIYDGGEKIQTKNKIEEKNKELASKTSANLFAKLSWLPFLGGSAETSASADFSLSGSSLVKTTLSNTVLTDFLNRAQNDERICVFNDYKVRAYKNSIAFFKMFTPFLKITKSDFTTDEGFVFDISKLDEAFTSGKGYYELIAENTVDGMLKKYIFRFNIVSFRNNYSIADLSKMDLNYYAVKVGKSEEEMLDISKEFNFEQKSISSAFDIMEDQSNGNALDVFDVILAGVDI